MASVPIRSAIRPDTEALGGNHATMIKMRLGRFELVGFRQRIYSETTQFGFKMCGALKFLSEFIQLNKKGAAQEVKDPWAAQVTLRIVRRSRQP
jgi:hypothetical protein